MIRNVPVFNDRKLYQLRNATPLVLQFSSDGGVVALRHGELLVNQIVTDPSAQGLFRLVVRERSGGAVRGCSALAGNGVPFAMDEERSMLWRAKTGTGLECRTRALLHPDLSAWMWSVTVTNHSTEQRDADILLAQDIGLGDEGAVRNNEAYNSHYLDLRPVNDPKLGWIILARQNQPTGAGTHPALAAACLDGARAYCTDGRQFYGASHRLMQVPAAFSMPELPSQVLQYECAMACLQSRILTLAPGASAHVRFLLFFIPDHPQVTGESDLAQLRALASWNEPAGACNVGSGAPASLWTGTESIAGDEPNDADWVRWFPGSRRHEERSGDGHLLSFFHGESTHVVSRRKEADIWRPHGHILRGGKSVGPDGNHFGLTCYASGVFAAQAYLGNPSLDRLLPVVRDQLGLLRSNGQRVFVRIAGRWVQLGVPSAFAMTPREARWFYRLGRQVIELTVHCSDTLAASFLEVKVIEGEPCVFLVTHRICLGATEETVPASVELNPADASAIITPLTEGTSYAIGMKSSSLARLGGDELIQPDASASTASYVVFETRLVERFTLVMTGVQGGGYAAARQLEAARAESGHWTNMESATPVCPRLRLPGNAATGRIDEILPWFSHDAWIHFSAPHGLEQSGGGAWGVRDVCQGSMEWLLATGRFEAARGVLLEVFRQQYVQDGDWPQWFMLPPHERIRQMDSHGDVIFWPLKALCLYLERSNDFSILAERFPYTDLPTLNRTELCESILEHCDRAVARIRERLLPGTSLVDYGNGDWDDTLQPADPALKTRMVSAWTVGLACQTFEPFAHACENAGDAGRSQTLRTLLDGMRKDFRSRLIVDGVVAGFLIRGESADTLLLHPRDESTGIRYRLIPMTRSILAGLFTPEEARAHADIIRQHLLFPDGVRLMSTPVAYKGGLQKFFRRAETAANVGREIGLMYVHAHLRYAEALAYMGDGEGLWKALQLVNPVGLREVLTQAEARQSNVFFSSSDADFADRYEATRRWEDLRKGKVPVRGGWRLYSSGPGLFINIVRSGLLGIRESFGDVVFDPVLPHELDGLSVSLTLLGRTVSLRYAVRGGGVRSLALNGVPLTDVQRDPNPYRSGGLRVSATLLQSLFSSGNNTITIEL
jgi:CRISPR-associated protein Csx3